MKPTKNLMVRGIARRLVLKLFLVVALLSASATAYGTVYFWEAMDDGSNMFLSCGSTAGNYWARCPDQDLGCSNCPCDICDTSHCQEMADAQCRRLGHGVQLEEEAR